MAKKQPPNINGVMELTDKQITGLRTVLEAIRDNFVESDEQPVADTFYLTATYNRENPKFPINGDTCEWLLSEDGEE